MVVWRACRCSNAAAAPTAAAPAVQDDAVAGAATTPGFADADDDGGIGDAEAAAAAEVAPAPCSCDLGDLSDRRRTTAERLLATAEGCTDSWLRFCRKIFRPDARLVCLILDAATAAASATVGSADPDDAAAAALLLALDNRHLRDVLLSPSNRRDDDAVDAKGSGEDCPRLADAAVTLLHTLVSRAPPMSAPASRLAGPLMLHYGASLSARDQRIAATVFRLRHSLPGDLSQCCWDRQLAECRRFQPDLASRLFAPPSATAVLAQLDPRRVLYTAVHFPVDRPWLAHPQPCVAPRPGLYDPCWVLPLLCRVQAAGADPRALVRHHCLALGLASLASHSERVRLLGLTFLAGLHAACDPEQQQLRALRFPERDQTRYLIGVARATLTSATRRLPCLVALFLARCAEVMLRPQQRMYRLLWRFLTVRSGLQLNTVPELWRFLLSDQMDHRVERQWLLQLMSDGARDLEDYRLLERSFAVKTLLAVFPAMDGTARCLTLRLLCRLAVLRPAAVALVNRHQLAVWLASFRPEGRLGPLCSRLVRDLWVTLVGRGGAVMPAHFVRQMRNLLGHPSYRVFPELAGVREQVEAACLPVKD